MRAHFWLLGGPILTGLDFLVFNKGGAVGGEESRVVASTEREVMRCLITQETSRMASSSLQSAAAGSRARIHHARVITTRNSPSLPPTDSFPQSSVSAPSRENGQLLVSLHSGWAADHHFTHSSSNSWIDSILGMLFLPKSRRPIQNHQLSSPRRGFVGNFPDPCGLQLVKRRHKTRTCCSPLWRMKDFQKQPNILTISPT